MDGVAVKLLTVSFHEGGFLSKGNAENRMGFWFQLDDQGRQQMGSPMGPANPQALNRYSYVQNNPLKYTDPSGHTAYLTADQANRLVAQLDDAANFLSDLEYLAGVGDVALIAAKIRDYIVTLTAAGGTALWVSGLLGAIMAIVLVEGTGLLHFAASELRWFANQIRTYTGPDGIAIATDDAGGVYFLNRTTGQAGYWKTHWWDVMGRAIYNNLPASTRLGAKPVGDPNWWKNFHFVDDEIWSP